MKRRVLTLMVLAALLVVVAAPANTPPELIYASNTARVELPAADDNAGLIPGTERRITWHDGEQRTAWAVVSLHGFSATRQETAPLAEIIARALGANLYETRLSGHGRRSRALHGVRAEDWLHDAERALAAGAALGDRIILMGSSTGATLMVALLPSELMQHVDTLVMLSPNFGPQGAGVAWLTRPYGPLLARAIAGDTRTWEPYNAMQGRYWTTSYPTSAVIEMMRLVDRANADLPASIEQRLLVFYSPDDTVVSPQATVDAYESFTARDKALIEVRDPGDPSHHVLAGDILSPDKTDEIAAAVVAFISRPVH